MEENDVLTQAKASLQQWLTTVQFQRCFRGVDESDVWKKFQELNDLYEKLLLAQQAQYEQRITQLEFRLRGDDRHE